MRLLIGCSVVLFGLLTACRDPSNRPATRSTPSSETSGSAPAPSSRSDVALASVVWRPLGHGVSWTRSERKDAEGRNTVWSVVRVILGHADLAVIEPPRARLEQLAKDPTTIAAVNGGFFEADGGPSGVLVSHGRRMGEFDARGGSGIFVVAADRARLVPAEPGVADAHGDLVLQCGPRLVEPDGTIGIRSDDGKRASRTAVCIRGAGREINLVLAWTRNSDRDGPGLLEMAQWLRQPLVSSDPSGCEAALNLDGGPSTGIVLRNLPEELHKPFGRVPFALVVRERVSDPAHIDR